MSKLRVPSKVLVAGKWWELKPFTKEKLDSMKDKQDIHFGETHLQRKVIEYNPKQHREEFIDTLLHEGIHAILCERSYKFGALAIDEEAVHLLTSDILAHLKQMDFIK